MPPSCPNPHGSAKKPRIPTRLRTGPWRTGGTYRHSSGQRRALRSPASSRRSQRPHRSCARPGSRRSPSRRPLASGGLDVIGSAPDQLVEIRRGRPARLVRRGLAHIRRALSSSGCATPPAPSSVPALARSRTLGKTSTKHALRVTDHSHDPRRGGSAEVGCEMRSLVRRVERHRAVREHHHLVAVQRVDNKQLSGT